MLTWLKDNATVIGALTGTVVAFVAILQFVVVGPMNSRLDDLNRRFDDMNQRFGDLRAEMNGRFDAQDKYVEARFDAMDQRFEAVDQRFDDLKNEMNQRLDHLTSELSALRTLVVGIAERVSRNEGAITLIREQLQAEGAPASPPNP